MFKASVTFGLKNIFILGVLLWILTACSRNGPTPTPMAAAEASTATSTAVPVIPTATPIPTPVVGEPIVSLPPPIPTGEEVGIAVPVDAAPGVDIIYEWAAPEGSRNLVGQGTSGITFQVPDEAGTHKIVVKIMFDGTVLERSVFITVEEEAPDMLTPTATATQTLSVAPTETSTPTNTPTDMPAPPPATFIANFDTCNGINNLGGTIGAFYEAPNFATEVFIPDQSSDCVVKLDYQLDTFAGLFMGLAGADFNRFNTLNFQVRGETTSGPFPRLKVELKRSNNSEHEFFYAPTISGSYQSVSIPFSSFQKVPWASSLSELSNMEELVFTLEALQAGSQGTVYIEDITLTRR